MVSIKNGITMVGSWTNSEIWKSHNCQNLGHLKILKTYANPIELKMCLKHCEIFRVFFNLLGPETIGSSHVSPKTEFYDDGTLTNLSRMYSLSDSWPTLALTPQATKNMGSVLIDWSKCEESKGLGWKLIFAWVGFSISGSHHRASCKPCKRL